MCTTKKEITESGLDLMRIQALMLSYSLFKNRKDFSKELSGTCQEVRVSGIADPATCIVLCD